MQRQCFKVMDLSSGNLRDKIIVVYLDDLIVFSRKRKHHVRDLRKFLVRCREHGLSLNPKECFWCHRRKTFGIYCFTGGGKGKSTVSKTNTTTQSSFQQKWSEVLLWTSELSKVLYSRFC